MGIAARRLVDLDPRRPFGYRDLESLTAAFPDGYRIELIAGGLFVSPKATVRHQRILANVLVLLHAAKLPTKIVLPEPNLLVGPAPLTTFLIPDVVVADENDVAEPNVVGVPDLVVEILSPSTAVVDRTTKRVSYQTMGVSAYWIVDPETETVTVLELETEGGGYALVERAVVTRGEPFEASTPWTLTVEVEKVFDL